MTKLLNLNVPRARPQGQVDAGVSNAQSSTNQTSADAAAPAEQAQVAESNHSDVAGDAGIGNVHDSTPAPVQRKALSGLKLNLGGRASTRPSSSAAATMAPPASPTVESPSGPEDSIPSGLAAIAGDESSGLPTIADTISGYEDEIPATAPERELPPEMDEQMKGFVQALDGIYNPAVMHDPELCGQMIRRIMSELQEQPQYLKMVADDDVAVMIRGMRESMGLARLRKQEGKAKRAGNAKSKSKTQDPEMVGDLASLAASMGMDFDG